MRNFVPFLAAALLVIPAFVTGEAQSQSLESVLLDAVAAGHTDFVKSLLDSGANIESKNKVGATPLIFASAKGHKDVVKLLVDRGANVNAKTTTGITPLIAAASAGDADIVKLLLEKGADASAKDQQGRTALNIAETTDDQPVIALLKSVTKTSGPSSSPIAKPTGQAHTEIIRQADSQGGLAVRAEPSPKGEIVTYLPVGSKVTYVGEANNGWVQLSAPTAGGWVTESYLGTHNLEATVISVDNPEQCLRVRNGPGTNHEKIGCLPKGATAELTGTEQNGWAQIATPITGWVTTWQIQAPGLFPAKPAASGVQKEHSAVAKNRSYRRQKSEDDFTQADDKEIDKEMSDFGSENENAGSFQPGRAAPGRVFRIGPLGIRLPF
jgi:uncharacterized protein YraI